ncbi:MAG: helix-turn-helix domain-containing protein [Dehalococcoidia bacterium]|nr:helix-turn-helix domain-containing protein [Dehalococcoidia bacterium]
MGELGTWLVRSREARGLTLEDAERDTRISRRYLLALETEQFDVIPAPVYARGFLRSYSQYLGLDPQEMLALFPREDEYDGASARQPRASRESPLPATSPARPSWNRPAAPPRPKPAKPESRQERPREPEYRDDSRFRSAPPQAEPRRDERRPQAAPPPQREPAIGMEAAPYEPMIGVDIGVPAPVRRINPDPAAQTRSMVVAIVAIAGVIGVVLLAFVISSLGGDSETPGGTAGGDDSNSTSTSTTTRTSTATTTATTTSAVPGTVPDVVGVPVAEAKKLLEAAGYEVNQINGTDAAAQGTVFEQTPQGGTSLAEGGTVTIAVSDGP